ncbi:MAG: hypothetical protein M3O70_15670 [Actinomycetota bacterium]|nr:hypothetical protein [Actinomycetota bacterium]
MRSSATAVRLRYPLSAVNGSVDALVFDVEKTLELSGAEQAAASFVEEIVTYRASSDATYRGVLEIISRYVDLS